MTASTYLDMVVRARAATGGRTFTGLAALTVTTPPALPVPAADPQPDRALRHPGVMAAVGVLAPTELVLDRLPQIPRRLGPPGLLGRAGDAALCGVIVARRRRARSDGPTAPGEPFGEPFGEPPQPGGPATDPAMIEDAAVIALAASAGVT